MKVLRQEEQLLELHTDMWDILRSEECDTITGDQLNSFATACLDEDSHKKLTESFPVLDQDSSVSSDRFHAVLTGMLRQSSAHSPELDPFVIMSVQEKRAKERDSDLERLRSWLLVAQSMNQGEGKSCSPLTRTKEIVAKQQQMEEEMQALLQTIARSNSALTKAPSPTPAPRGTSTPASAVAPACSVLEPVCKQLETPAADRQAAVKVSCFRRLVVHPIKSCLGLRPIGLFLLVPVVLVVHCGVFLAHRTLLIPVIRMCL